MPDVFDLSDHVSDESLVDCWSDLVDIKDLLDEKTLVIAPIPTEDCHND